ncbi:stage V sporulation protein AE [Symbiobacterium thermophilum]|uniref:Stage V sporulation protein AE n=1 Tax=Symbiobacterium thermophilum (strain DSM 24528 / JCM 14929 / IAM 14863 / T) TaxID=292459 RepID=Q67NE7_SYMTH|nr:stage V sporulation protein AE [Symbiobacterium thermophilum IAM 14863]
MLGVRGPSKAAASPTARLADPPPAGPPVHVSDPAPGGIGLKPPVRVILLTDGDSAARRVAENVAQRLGLRCISASAGNPTPLSGPELVALIKQAVHDPVLVMVDDKGDPGTGPGEEALAYICRHPDIRVLGAVAVASNTRARGVEVDVSIDREGRVRDGPVDKDGQPRRRGRLKGDTVDVLNRLSVPIIVGVGDPGKTGGEIDLEAGCEITARAIRQILERS